MLRPGAGSAVSATGAVNVEGAGGAAGAPKGGVGKRIWASLAAVALGALALIPVGAEVLCVARGLCYGLVDRGPYNHSWGGPTLAGAWAAHFAVSLPLVALGLLVLGLLLQLG
jgi:hypothetical protein